MAMPMAGCGFWACGRGIARSPSRRWFDRPRNLRRRAPRLRKSHRPTSLTSRDGRVVRTGSDIAIAATHRKQRDSLSPISTISASLPATTTTSPTPLPNSARASGDACEIVAVRGVGFVFADDSERLPPVILAHDGDGVAEPYDRIVRRLRDHRRRRATRAPIADIAAGGAKAARSPPLAPQPERLARGQRFLDPRGPQPSRHSEDRRSAGQAVLDIPGFLDERSAHACQTSAVPRVPMNSRARPW